MSKTHNIITLLLGIATTLFAVSCENDTTPVNTDPPTIHVENKHIVVGGNGGELTIPYTIVNSVAGVTAEVTCDQEWITDIKVYNKIISCSVTKSDIREIRSARLKVTYPGCNSSESIFIEQEEMILDIIDITTSNMTYSCCDITFTPRDNTLRYISNIISIDYFISSGISDEQSFLAEELGYMQTLANNMGITLEEYLTHTRLLTTGPLTKSCSNLTPGSKYIVYAYGLDITGNDYTLSVPIHHIELILPMPELINISFDVSVNSSGNTLRGSVTPDIWDGYYVVQVAAPGSLYYVTPGQEMLPSVVKALNTTFFEQARNTMAQGMDAETYLNRYCSQGRSQINITVEKGIEYMLIIYAVRSENGLVPVMYSNPQISYISL